MLSGKMTLRNRWVGFLIIALCYLLAAVLGVWTYRLVSAAPWLSLLAADLTATVFIWLMSQLLRNASVYDPFWSVQPPVILALALAHQESFDLGSLLLVLAVGFWGARLTMNWMGTFQGLHRQDWRYDRLERKSGACFPLVNLLGIQLLPTLIVYGCLLPGFYYILRGGGLSLGTGLGVLLVLGGALLEMAADIQLQRFRRITQDRSQLLREGLWRHSRHPNYLGEILVWWGVFVVLLASHPNLWFLSIGALMNTCLFLFVSIPMAEHHLASYKQGYGDYQRETPMLLPVPWHGSGKMTAVEEDV